MNKLYKSLLVISLTSCIANANATETYSQGYVGVGVGKVDLDEETFDDPTGFELIGGYTINENFAVEVSYVDFGKASDNEPPEFKISADSLTVGAVGIIPIESKVELFAKVGFHSWDIEATQAGYGKIAEDDGTDLFWGLGGNYKLSDQAAIGVKYMKYDFGSDVDSDVTMLSATFRYKF